MSCFICEETAFIFNYLFLFYFFVEQGDGRGVFVLCYKLQWQYLGITTKSTQNVTGTKNPWSFCLTFLKFFFSFSMFLQFRRYQKRLADSETPYPVVPGLTDSRRAELQNAIADRRQKYPVCVQFQSVECREVIVSKN